MSHTANKRETCITIDTQNTHTQHPDPASHLTAPERVWPVWPAADEVLGKRAGPPWPSGGRSALCTTRHLERVVLHQLDGQELAPVVDDALSESCVLLHGNGCGARKSMVHLAINSCMSWLTEQLLSRLHSLTVSYYDVTFQNPQIIPSFLHCKMQLLEIVDWARWHGTTVHAVAVPPSPVQ
mmetsp:Transcript_14522/g.34647  ORF Transcript_14522/g.34647 Transcript_14522/m.34647 type:complete len:182 (-) Transcript_14522:134-679(-)